MFITVFGPAKHFTWAKADGSASGEGYKQSAFLHTADFPHPHPFELSLQDQHLALKEGVEYTFSFDSFTVDRGKLMLRTFDLALVEVKKSASVKVA